MWWPKERDSENSFYGPCFVCRGLKREPQIDIAIMALVGLRKTEGFESLEPFRVFIVSNYFEGLQDTLHFE